MESNQKHLYNIRNSLESYTEKTFQMKYSYIESSYLNYIYNLNNRKEFLLFISTYFIISRLAFKFYFSRKSMNEIYMSFIYKALIKVTVVYFPLYIFIYKNYTDWVIEESCFK